MSIFTTLLLYNVNILESSNVFTRVNIVLIETLSRSINDIALKVCPPGLKHSYYILCILSLCNYVIYLTRIKLYLFIVYQLSIKQYKCIKICVWFFCKMEKKTMYGSRFYWLSVYTTLHDTISRIPQ